ncbi:MAG: type II toxin-antitoxin system VapC family toxin [Acidobacteria bacterium]|nr:type II toxin-antitoxin system VapC family toxin [Acidobacteriota bacterium]
MILLDTNVLSELMRRSPEPRVLQWMDSRPAAEMWISAVTVCEIRLGIALLPEGLRKDLLADLAEAMFQEDFSERCLPFDFSAAAGYASIVAARTRQGRPIKVEDAQIAAIALSGGLTLATRNTKDFAGIDRLTLVNPWND